LLHFDPSNLSQFVNFNIHQIAHFKAIVKFANENEVAVNVGSEETPGDLRPLL